MKVKESTILVETNKNEGTVPVPVPYGLKLTVTFTTVKILLKFGGKIVEGSERQEKVPAYEN